MNTSLYNGLSGILTNQFGIDTWSNNIANINNYGYKQNIPEFKNIFESSLSEEAYGSLYTDNVGHGSTAQSSAIDMSQGALVETGNKFDLAVSGEGWFAVDDGGGNIFYTRSGAFTKDANGYLIDPNGNFLLGTSAKNINNDGEVTIVDGIELGEITQEEKILLPPYLKMQGKPTTNLFFGTNLDPSVKIGPTEIPLSQNDYNVEIENKILNISGGVVNTKELLDPKKGDTVIITIKDQKGGSISKFAYLQDDLTWNYDNINLKTLDFQTQDELSFDIKVHTTQELVNTENYGIEVFSPVGEREIIDLTFKKEVPQSPDSIIWNGEAVLRRFLEKKVDGKAYDPQKYVIEERTNNVYEILDKQTGVLKFNEDGALISNTLTTISNDGIPLTLDFGSFYDPNIPNSGFDGFTSFAGVDMDRQNVIKIDGYVYGELNDYNIDQNGQIIAEFSNGKTTPIARIALHDFQNDQGLSKVGDNLYMESVNSGEAKFFEKDFGLRIHSSKILSGKLESSNVSMGEALTELIVYQKALQASAKSITTSDQMLKRAIDMKT